MLNNCCVNDIEVINIADRACEQAKVSSAIDKFVEITGNNLNDSRAFEVRNELRNVFFEYLDHENINVCDIDSLDNIAKVAFYRLVKASRTYFYEKNTNSSYEYVESLRIKANNYKRDYELIMISS